MIALIQQMYNKAMYYNLRERFDESAITQTLKTIVHANSTQTILMNSSAEIFMEQLVRKFRVTGHNRAEITSST